MIETNGPANMIMMLDLMLEMGTIAKEDHAQLKEQAEKTVKYILQLKNPNNINWFDMK